MKKLSFVLFLSIAFNSFGQTEKFHPGQLYLKLKNSEEVPSLDKVKLLVSNFDATAIVSDAFETSDEILDRIFHIKHSLSINSSFLIEGLSNFPEIEYVEQLAIHEIFYSPNDYQTSQYNLDKIQAKKAWDLTKGDTNVVVAMIDDAVLLSHPDLKNKIWRNWKEIPNNNKDDDGNGWVDDVYGWDAADSDNNPNPVSNASSTLHSHGTHCAGIVGAETNNSKGISSIGINIKIMPVKIGYKSGSRIRLRNVYSGVDYAIKNKANVISMSWGRGGGGASKTEQALFDVAFSRNIVCVAAAGNSYSYGAHWPASYNHVISVASTDAQDKKSGFSTYHPTVDVSAPGSSIHSCVPGSGLYDYKSGTSMACPLVSGICALMISVDPNITISKLESCLKSSCDNINAQNTNYLGNIGAGRVNAFKAIKCIKPLTAYFSVDKPNSCPGTTLKFKDLSSPIATSWKWSFPGGTPTSSTSQNPSVSYSTEGKYKVQLIATNNIGSDTIKIDSFITIQKPNAKLTGKSTIAVGGIAFIKFDFVGFPNYKVIFTDGAVKDSFVATTSPYYHPVKPTKSSYYWILKYKDSLCLGDISDSAEVIVSSSFSSYGPGGIGDKTGSSNLQLWLMADDGFNSTNGNPVSSWKDQSGAGNDMTATGTKRPSFIASGYKGKPAMSFNGSSNYMENAGLNASFKDTQITMFVVKKGISSGSMISISAYNTWSNEYLILNKGVFHHRSSGNFSYRYNHCSSSMDNTKADITCAILGKTALDIELYSNGLISNSSITKSGTNVGDFIVTDRKIKIGQRGQITSGEYFKGEILEVIAYNKKLSSSERKAVENYLRCKYQIEKNGCGTNDKCLVKNNTNNVSCNKLVSLNKISDTKGNFTGTLTNNSQFGYSTANIGDVNKDGIPDLAVGSANKYYSGGNKGSIWILFMNSNGTVKSQQEIGQNIGGLSATLSNNELFGNSISALGDFNKDGIPDVMVGSRSSDGGKFKGALWLLYLNSNGTVKSHSKISSTSGGLGSTAIQGQAVFGADCDTIGDLNKDGVMDIAVSAYRDNEGLSEGGAVFILFMNSNGTVKSHKKLNSSTSALSSLVKSGDRIGLALSCIGDINKDGNSDIVVSAYTDATGGSNRGALYTIKLKSSGDILSVKKLTSSDQLTFIKANNHLFTYDLSFIKKDETSFDLFAANHLSDSGGTNRGAFYRLKLDTGGNLMEYKEYHAQLPPLSVLKNSDQFGVSVGIWRTGSDTLKIMVGALADDDGGTDKGAIYIVNLLDTCAKCAGEKEMFSSSFYDSAKSIRSKNLIKLRDGNLLLMTGHETSVYSTLYKTYEKEMVLIKKNPNGKIIWTKRLTGTKDIGSLNAISPLNIMESSDNSIYVALTTHIGTSAKQNIYLLKLDKDGNKIWTKYVQASAIDYGTTLYQKGNGNILLGGTISSQGSAQTDEFLCEVSPGGNIVWSKSYYTTGRTGGNYHLWTVLELNNNIYSLGRITPNGGGYQGSGIVKRHDSSGNIKWTKYLSNSGNGYAKDMIFVDDKILYVGDIYSKGAGGGDFVASLLDTSGNEIWTKTYGTSAKDLAITAIYKDGLIYIYGRTSKFYGGKLTTLGICIDKTGKLIWSKTYGQENIIFENSLVSYKDGIALLTTNYAGNKPKVVLDILNSCGESSCGQENVPISLKDISSTFISMPYSTINLNVSLTKINVTSVNFSIKDSILCDNRQGCKLEAGFNYLVGECPNDSTTFTNTSLDPTKKQVYWKYDFGDGGTSVGIENPKHLYKDTGSYKVKIIVGSTLNSEICFDSTINFVYIQHKLIVDASSNKDTICIGDTAYLSAEILCGKAPYSIKWTPSANLNNDSILNPAANPKTSQSYILEVTDSNGVKGRDTVVVIVNSNCCKSFARFDVIDDEVCLGDSIFTGEYSDTLGSVTHSWTINPSAQITSYKGKDLPPLVFTSSGRKTIQLITSGNCGLDTMSKEVIIFDLPIVDAGKDTSICMPDTVSLGTSDLANMNYYWKDPNLVQDSSKGITKAYITSLSTLYLTVSDPYSGCANIDSILVSDLKATKVDLGRDTVICEGDSVRLGVTITGNYSWSTNETTQYIYYKDTGNVILTIGQNGCSQSDTIHIGHNPVPNFSIGKDSTLCMQDSLLLKPTPIQTGSYLWENKSSSTQKWVKNTGLYWLEITDNQCSFRDSVNIKSINLQEINLGNDTTFCSGETLEIGTGQSGNYNWNTNDKTSKIIVKDAGLYWLELSSANCKVRDSINIDINEIPAFNLGSDTIICDAETIILQPDHFKSSYNYLWDNNSTDSTRTISDAGNYWLEIDNSGCKKRELIRIEKFSSPLDFFLGPDTILCDADNHTLQAPKVDGYTYLWQDGSNKDNFNVTEEGSYSVIIKNKCGEIKKDIFIEYKDCECLLIYPTAFTPNNKEPNNVFLPHPCQVFSYELSIFNRWGEKLFTSHDLLIGWDGTFAGKPVMKGNYLYKVVYTTERFNRRVKIADHGIFTLLR